MDVLTVILLFKRRADVLTAILLFKCRPDAVKLLFKCRADVLTAILLFNRRADVLTATPWKSGCAGIQCVSRTLSCVMEDWIVRTGQMRVFVSLYARTGTLSGN